MPRMARAVLPGTPHHLTQRGLDRQQVFSCNPDYDVYLALACSCAQRFGVDLIGYCLMPDHVHWVVSPPRPIRSPGPLARPTGDTPPTPTPSACGAATSGRTGSSPAPSTDPTCGLRCGTWNEILSALSWPALPPSSPGRVPPRTPGRVHRPIGWRASPCNRPLAGSSRPST